MIEKVHKKEHWHHAVIQLPQQALLRHGVDPGLSSILRLRIILPWHVFDLIDIFFVAIRGHCSFDQEFSRSELLSGSDLARVGEEQRRGARSTPAD